MPALLKPNHKPTNACFSCGPCAKIDGWNFDHFDCAILGRSHRSDLAKQKMAELVQRTRALLNLPEGYGIGITAGSDTGAMELAMWNLLGPKPVDVLAWEHFSGLWLQDICHELKLPDVQQITAPFGELPDLSQIDRTHDVVFAWNGTTSGVRVPNGDWLPEFAEGDGLRICDATSAVFAYDLPFDKLDVVTWSWQKVMGAEAAHGMVVFSSRAIQRLKDYTPHWPMPKIFQIKDRTGQIDSKFFDGVPVNTPSMLCVEDALHSLRWMEKLGGTKAVQAKVNTNANVLYGWLAQSDWAEATPKDPAICSLTSVCFGLKPELAEKLTAAQQIALFDKIKQLLADEAVAFDISSYKGAPIGLRFWIGATVEASNIAAMLPWLDWAYAQAKAAI